MKTGSTALLVVALMAGCGGAGDGEAPADQTGGDGAGPGLDASGPASDAAAPEDWFKRRDTAAPRGRISTAIG